MKIYIQIYSKIYIISVEEFTFVEQVYTNLTQILISLETAFLMSSLID